jgi:hypothetical protein
VIIKIELLLLLDQVHVQQVCCNVRVIEGLYQLCCTVCLGAAVQAWKDLKVAIELLSTREELMHGHLIWLLEGMVL